MSNVFVKDGKFPLGAWISPPPKVLSYEKSFVEERYFRLAAEAGLNMLYALYENLQNFPEETARALQYCEKYGIGYLLNDNAMRADDFDEQAFLQSAAAYENSPAFVGLHVKDEPGIVHFSALRAKKDAFLKKFPDKLFYVNLLPSYATQYQLKNGMWTEEDPAARAEYGAYLKDYVREVQPQFISYDFYPMEGEYPAVKEGYFENLQLVAECAAAADLPFWVFIQACAFQPHVRVPNAVEIFWQVNTALAYGAKGVQYFTFVQPADSEFETFRGGMIDRRGNVTEIYEAVREIDRHVLVCGEYLLHANPASITHGEFLESKFVGESGTFKYIVNVSLTQEKELHLPACRAIVRGKRVESSRFILAPGEGILVETEVDL